MNRFRIDRLVKQNRSDFDCGNEPLNEYLRRHAGQDQRRRCAVCFLAIENATDRIAGYYTLASGSVDLDRLPADVAKRLPRYPATPVIKIGRLAVAMAFQGTGLARALLADAYKRVLELDVGAFALAVDAIDDDAEAFYQHHGFLKLQSRTIGERLLLLPIV
ncbi:GNAT family N-acetyltransferase [Rosistilla oblonga]|uniref:GNAT family N-acetyltransferase n=1 Tax=Rosistilla oblonga TaxID=2527990 RepID=UPI003A97B4EC